MPVPSSITDLSTTASSNSPAGSETPADGDNYLRAHAAFIAQLNANKLDKAGTVIPTANQPMGGYKFTGAANASASGEFVVWGQTLLRLTVNEYVNVSSNALWSAVQIIGAGNSNLPFKTSAGIGGGLVLATGSDTGGNSWSQLYLLAVRQFGGAGALVTAATVSTTGPGTPPTIAFSDSGGYVNVAVSGASANQSYFCGIGGFASS